MQNLNEAKKFEQWMRNIGNVHRVNNEQMRVAYKRVTPVKCDPKYDVKLNY